MGRAGLQKEQAPSTQESRAHLHPSRPLLTPVQTPTLSLSFLVSTQSKAFSKLSRMGVGGWPPITIPVEHDLPLGTPRSVPACFSVSASTISLSIPGGSLRTLIQNALDQTYFRFLIYIAHTHLTCVAWRSFYIVFVGCLWYQNLNPGLLY